MAKLPPIVIDFETYFASDYTLASLDTTLYVRDPRFEVIGFSCKEPGQAAKWFSGTHDYLALILASLYLGERTVIAHNAMFDGAILEWRFDIKPHKYLCSMMLARPFVVPFRGRASLRTCAEHLKLPDKGDFVTTKARGKHRSDFTPAELAEYGTYSCNDCDISDGIAAAYQPKMCADELDLIDLTVKKFTRPRLVLDKRALLQEKDAIAQREAMSLLKLASMKLTREHVTSNQKLEIELVNRGVDVPRKPSLATGFSTLAMAKTDPMFLALRAHPDPEVRTLVESRLALKSSIDRTRVGKFLDIAAMAELLPVPLLYYGAHTGRFSGMSGINLQNLPKGSALREALRAPPRYKVIVADLNAIEARITAVLAEQWNLVEAFRQGRDVYAEFAAELFRKPIQEITEAERFIAKSCVLGMSYGLGAAKFRLTMNARGVSMTEAQAIATVNEYRRFYASIPKLWRKLNQLIKYMASAPISDAAWQSLGPVRMYRERVELPNGLCLYYPGLATEPTDPDRYTFKTLRATKTPVVGTKNDLWGGSLCENIVQALARIVISRAEVRLARAGLVSVMQVHDELVFVVPDEAVGQAKRAIELALTAPVPWMPELPLACSIGSGDSYGEAK